MAISRGLVTSLVIIGLGCVGYLQYGESIAGLAAWGTAASQRPIPQPAAEGFTEEQWTVMEVCDQIVFILHPELLAQPAGAKRITAQRNRSTPVSYTVEAGQAKSTVALSTPVWDPATYQVWCQAVSRQAQAQASATGAASRQNILTDLLNPGTATYLALDARLSQELARHPRDAGLCTDAALLLGTMAWLDAAGHFQDVRPLLNRMTAFLAVADAFGASGSKREVAEILRLALLHDEVGALAKITAARASAETIPAGWLDALEVTVTGDWRKTERLAVTGPALLQLAHYRVLTRNMTANQAENFLKTAKNPVGAEWVRFLTQSELGIRQGHTYSRKLLSLEAAEANAVAKSLGEGSLVKPETAFVSYVHTFDATASYERAPEARVMGRQLWAGRTQRHLLQSMLVLHDFLANHWGVPDQAAAFVAEMRKQFSKAYYYPFLALELEKKSSPQYKEALLAGDNLARQQPAMIAPELWVALKPESREAVERGSPNFHHFFNPELPRLTSFEAGKRIYEIGVGDENSLNLLQEILARCPYDYEMAFQTALVEGRPDRVEAKRLECCERFADTWRKAMRWVAHTAGKNPQKYERLKAREAENNPDAYVELAGYFDAKGDIERAEKYLLQAHGKVDSVYFANTCGFLVGHYARTGRMNEAERMAKEAADTYSGAGLGTYAWLKEYRQEWDEAFKIYQAIDERYGGKIASEAGGFALRRKVAGRGWNDKYQPLLDAIFPRGTENISAATVGATAPGSGVCFTTLTEELREAGVGPKDVVVGLDGVRVNTVEQYTAVRSLSDSPDMLFLIWDGQAYSELKVRQPGRRFNTGLRTYGK